MHNTKLLLGKEVSKHLKKKLKNEITILNKNGIIPKLAAILIGDDPASKIYVNTKHKTFLKMSCDSVVHKLPSNTSNKAVISLIEQLNMDDLIHGILVQFPLPKQLDDSKIISSISPKKDVDGLHPQNFGLLLQGKPNFIPCTPYGCLHILKYYNIDVSSKNVVIIGRSNLVGKPLFAILSQKFDIGNATVTLCHSRTKKLENYTKNADIIIAATGIPSLLKADMVKSGVIIIDVGINRILDKNNSKGYKIVGDVDYKEMLGIASAITPVPGGVGPMTITMLLYNTINSAKNILS